jgi:hypothetical protein
MDLSNPMISDGDKLKIDHLAENLPLDFYPEEFIKMYYEDQIGGLIRNVEFWIQDVFKELLENQQ